VFPTPTLAFTELGTMYITNTATPITSNAPMKKPVLPINNDKYRVVIKLMITVLHPRLEGWFSDRHINVQKHGFYDVTEKIRTKD